MCSNGCPMPANPREPGSLHVEDYSASWGTAYSLHLVSVFVSFRLLVHLVTGNIHGLLKRSQPSPAHSATGAVTVYQGSEIVDHRGLPYKCVSYKQ